MTERRALSIWRRHPALAGEKLRFRDIAADQLKHWFGTWTALGAVAAWIAIWVVTQRFQRFDPYPYILLNLCLSCLAAVQGIILQISANRGDRISAQVALHTEQNTDQLVTLQNEQLVILRSLTEVSGQLEAISAVVCGPAGE
jgi:uncharacterized membrane protein